MTQTGANTTVIYVPAAGAPDAILEALDAGIKTIFCITEHIPALDMLQASLPRSTRPAHASLGPTARARRRSARPRSASSRAASTPGRVGVVSRSGTLTYEVVEALTEAGIGQSTCVGIGGDPINGSNFVDILKLFRDDPDTDAVVLIGEIGGDAEERAADWIAENMSGVPMASFIAGRTAPPGRRMGHAGAIISGNRGTAQSKVAALERRWCPRGRSAEPDSRVLRNAGVRPD